MAERIKSLRQKQSETLYGPEVPIGADLANVDVSQTLIDAFYAATGEEKPSSPSSDAEFYINKLIEMIQTQGSEVQAKAPKNHASVETTYGIGSEIEYGHLKLVSDLTTAIEGAAFSQSAMITYSQELAQKNQELIQKNQQLTEQLSSVAGQKSILATATDEGLPSGVDTSILTAGSLWFIQK